MKFQHKNNSYRPHERLFVAGQLSDFEQAVLATDRSRASCLLMGVGFSEQETGEIVRDIFADPRKYGYCPEGCLQQKPKKLLSNCINLS